MMDTTLIILLGMLFLAIIAVFWQGKWPLLISGLKNSGELIKQVWLRLILGLLLGGLITVLLPSSLILDWLGPTSGWAGILIGTSLGLILGGGGPYMMMPILASMLTLGAGIGPILALLASLNIIGLRGLFVWQIPFLGVRLSLARYLACLPVPIIVGFLGTFMYEALV